MIDNVECVCVCLCAAMHNRHKAHHGFVTECGRVRWNAMLFQRDALVEN